MRINNGKGFRYLKYSTKCFPTAYIRQDGRRLTRRGILRETSTEVRNGLPVDAMLVRVEAGYGFI